MVFSSSFGMVQTGRQNQGLVANTWQLPTTRPNAAQSEGLLDELHLKNGGFVKAAKAKPS